MLTRDEVRWLYFSILNREPENEGIYEAFSKHADIGSARNSLLYSYEFFMIMKDRLSDFSATYKACDYPMMPVTAVPIRPTLGVACIMKNEEKHIARMVQSCLPVCDVFAIIDTGSTDDSIKIVEKVVPKHKLFIESIPFEDFSQARNAALRLILGKSDWTLFLDADEYIVPEDRSKLLNLIASDVSIDGWRLPRYTFLDEEQLLPPNFYPDYQQRLLKNRPGIYYQGRVHEQVGGVQRWGWAPSSEIASGGSCGGPHIHHTALVKMSRETELRKARLYQSLA